MERNRILAEHLNTWQMERISVKHTRLSLRTLINPQPTKPPRAFPLRTQLCPAKVETID